MGFKYWRLHKSIKILFVEIKFLYKASKTHLVSRSNYSDIKIWDIQTEKCIKTLEGHSANVSSILLLSKNSLASGSLDKKINIWDLQTGVCLKTLP